jgi:hypothetical protein
MQQLALVQKQVAILNAENRAAIVIEKALQAEIQNTITFIKA